jgi:hypothetical protein
MTEALKRDVFITTQIPLLDEEAQVVMNEEDKSLLYNIHFNCLKLRARFRAFRPFIYPLPQHHCSKQKLKPGTVP